MLSGLGLVIATIWAIGLDRIAVSQPVRVVSGCGRAAPDATLGPSSTAGHVAGVLSLLIGLAAGCVFLATASAASGGREYPIGSPVADVGESSTRLSASACTRISGIAVLRRQRLWILRLLAVNRSVQLDDPGQVGWARRDRLDESTHEFGLLTCSSGL